MKILTKLIPCVIFGFIVSIATLILYKSLIFSLSVYSISGIACSIRVFRDLEQKRKARDNKNLGLITNSNNILIVHEFERDIIFATPDICNYGYFFFKIARLISANYDCSSSLNNKKRYPFLIINMDKVDNDLPNFVEDLAKFRSNQNIITIITSSFFSGDDYSTARSTVADVSLKIPYTKKNLHLALDIAQKNFLSRKSA